MHHLLHRLKVSTRRLRLDSLKATGARLRMQSKHMFKLPSSPKTKPVLLPPALVPESKKRSISPVAPLHKALRGHPESSAHWAKHLHAILLELGGRELEGMPSVYYSANLTLAGRIEAHPAFWHKLAQRIELEQFAPLTRVLGRTHRPVWFDGKPALSLDTADFAGNASSCTFPSLGVMSSLHLLLIWMKVRCLSVIMSRVDSLLRLQHA